MKLKTVAETGCVYLKIKRARRRVMEFNITFLKGLPTPAVGGMDGLTNFSAAI